MFYQAYDLTVIKVTVGRWSSYCALLAAVVVFGVDTANRAVCVCGFI